MGAHISRRSILLLSLGASAAHSNSEGRTAADEAERNGMDALAELLRTAEREGFPSSAWTRYACIKPEQESER